MVLDLEINGITRTERCIRSQNNDGPGFRRDTGDRRLYRLGIKVDYGGMDELYAMNKTIASRFNDPCSVIAALR